MNRLRRKRIENIVEELDQIKEEEQEALENIPENLQDSERAQIMETNVDALEDVYGTLMDLLESQL